MGRRALAVLMILWLAGCASAGRPTGAGQFALTGTVRAEPGCPGPVRLDSPCPPRPIADATVEADQAGHPIAHTTTGPDGRFKLLLPAGTYQVTTTNSGGLKTTATQTVTLTAPVDITLTVDSGLR